MKYLVLAIVLILLQGNNTEDFVKWDKDNKLKWEDFEKQLEGNSIWAAESRLSLHIKFDQPSYFDVQILVEPLFLKSKSWVKIKSNYGLIHEQKHFDIVEIVARKERREINKQKFSTPKEAKIFCMLLHERMELKLDSLQELYDSETVHSTKMKEQSIWNNKIELELNELSEFSNSIINIDFRKRR